MIVTEVFANTEVAVFIKTANTEVPVFIKNVEVCIIFTKQTLDQSKFTAQICTLQSTLSQFGNNS